MIIQHNMSASNTGRQLGIISSVKENATRKLSSGYRINQSADDAAGLSISEKMRKQIRGLDRASSNIEDGISYAQVADGSLSEVHEMLQRINELSVQAANGTNSTSDRSYIDSEVQQLKQEMERVFTTTSFNDKKIWEENISLLPKVIGSTQVQAITVSTPRTQSIEVTNENYRLLPTSMPTRVSANTYDYTYNSSSFYTLHANNADGVNVSWTAYNGNTYTTKPISWNELEANSFRFNIGDYFDDTGITQDEDKLLDTNGKPKFDFTISFNVKPEAKIPDDISSAINNTTMSSSVSSSWQFENKGNSFPSGVYIYASSFAYGAAYGDSNKATLNNGGLKSGYNFEVASDDYIKPVLNASGNSNVVNAANEGKDIASARTSTDSWNFAFTMEGLGDVNASLGKISYYSNDQDADDENKLWKWVIYNTNPLRREKSQLVMNPSTSLSGFMDALTGDVDQATPGLLNKSEGGGSDSGGKIFMTFNVDSKDAYQCGNGTSNTIGNFTLCINVSNTDTEQSILDKLNDIFNSSQTLFDLNNKNKCTNNVYSSTVNTALITVNKIDLVKDEKNMDLDIHSGSETSDKINFEYDCLRLRTLGLSDTNVQTQENALKAIDEVSSAINIISAQRSLFGAYQNRMEHAYNINKNTSENTQAAESQIRDTDMAQEMVHFSNTNILEQAGQSMLAQANQANQGILSLLQ